jgi:phosphoserine phosphatase RsbU/P
MLKELEKKQLQLHWLLQITKAINYNLPAQTLFEIYQSVLRDHLKVERMALLVRDESWKLPVTYGTITDIPQEMTTLAASIDVFNASSDDSPLWLKQFETIVPVIHEDKALAYVLIGGLHKDIFNSKREIITYIHTITSVIAVALENKRMTRDSIVQAAIEKELELAAQMQSMLFPSSLVSAAFPDIAATYIPHQQVGGDYYDFITLSEHDALVCMADVSGKGISAALLMSNFQANLHALVKHYVDLPTLVNLLNERVYKSAQGEKHITFFIAHINKEHHTIRYINAGHNPPLLAGEDLISILDKGTTGLGMFEELPFINEGTSDFGDGSILFCYTDGITDMENNLGVAFGMELLSDLLMRHKQAETMNHLHEEMVKAFDEFRQQNSFTDDVTFLSLRMKSIIR